MKLSEYELLRLERIKRNEERMKELGLHQFSIKKPKPKKRKTVSKVKRVSPGQERRSKRLSPEKKKNDDLVMLDYRARDGEEVVSKQSNTGYDSDETVDDTPQQHIGTIIRKKFPETGKYYEGEVIDYDSTYKWYRIKYLDGQEEDFDEAELSQYRKYKKKPSRTRNRSRRKSRTFKIDAEEWKLSEKDRKCLASSADENFLAKFQEFLEYENRISEQNKRNVMRQVRKLASGEGIRYESPTYGWPEGCYFKKDEKITPMSDIVELMIEGQACEDEWGRDHGNGWLISHPLKKLLLFQQFVLKNPDFLTSKLRLRDYCE